VTTTEDVPLYPPIEPDDHGLLDVGASGRPHTLAALDRFAFT
jgi:hypothetical protein